VTAQLATLEEIMRFWDIVEVYDAIEVLDLQEEVARRNAPRPPGAGV
jgi:hypothetical protein